MINSNPEVSGSKRNRSLEETGKNDKKKLRLVACLRCRGQKLKCLFSNPQSSVCDRCKNQKKVCVFEKKFDELDWRKQTDEKIERLESSINNLIALLQAPKVNGSSLCVEGEMTREEITDDSNEVNSNEESSPIHKILSDKEIDFSLDFFYNTLSKYLPIFIFDYIPKINRDIGNTSNLLLSSILSVTSLYMPEFRHHHEFLLSQFKVEAGNLSPSQIFDKNGRPFNLTQTLYDILGCIIAAAWVGDDVGARCCLIASDLAGRLNPQILEDLKISDTEKRAVFAFSLTTYIIERRLQISYTKSDFNAMKNEMSANRDFFLPLYLNKMFIEKDNSEPVSTEYKVNANVELCTLIMAFQTELGKQDSLVSSDFILSWSSKLNMWLADWIGRLTTHLDPSSMKPTLLTFHFAKLFLYIQAINNIKRNKDNLHILFSRSETAASDIIEMLLLDKDIRRLIKVGPVFYATIFVTAAALLLKIITIGPKFNYKFNDKHLIATSERAYNVLSECVPDYQFPCFQSIQSLGNGITKVKERMAQKMNVELQFDNVNPINSKYSPVLSSTNEMALTSGNANNIVNQENSLGMTEQNFDLRFETGPFLNIEPNDFLHNSSTVNPLTDYKEVWESTAFDNENFLWNGFNADLMRSLYESPPEETN